MSAHPHQADGFVASEFEVIFNAHKSNPKLCAIGEIGLDYFYNFSSPEKQKPALIITLTYLAKKNSPWLFTIEKVMRDMTDLLKNHVSNMHKKGVIHSSLADWSSLISPLNMISTWALMACVLLKQFENVREAIKLCPIDQILLETDSPFLTPTPYRGIENSPSYLHQESFKKFQRSKRSPKE